MVFYVQQPLIHGLTLVIFSLNYFLKHFNFVVIQLVSSLDFDNQLLTQLQIVSCNSWFPQDYLSLTLPHSKAILI